MNLNKLLKLWQTNKLITKEQSNNILDFMKERRKELLFSFMKWIIIIGTFWLILGLIISIINIFELDIFAKIWHCLTTIFNNITTLLQNYIFTPIYNHILLPIGNLIYKIFDENQVYFYIGLTTLCISILLLFIDRKIKPKKEIENLNLSDDQKNILKTNWVLNTCSAVFLASSFCLFNMLLIPVGHYESSDKILPLWNIIGAITFTGLAYKFKKNMYLIFGIYFISLSVGMFTGYNCACYWIGVSRPIIQILVGIILIGIAYITELHSNIKKLEDKNYNNYIEEKFAETYTWTGLFLLFIALWITSIWGFNLNLSYSYPQDSELWFANILFIITSIVAMYIGSKTEKKIYFNYGLTFLIIETYTVIFSRLWSNIPTGLACLLTGAVLIGTGKIIQSIYLKKIKK